MKDTEALFRFLPYCFRNAYKCTVSSYEMKIGLRHVIAHLKPFYGLLHKCNEYVDDSPTRLAATSQGTYGSLSICPAAASYAPQVVHLTCLRCARECGHWRRLWVKIKSDCDVTEGIQVIRMVRLAGESFSG
jgi:hypothetical protein